MTVRIQDVAHHAGVSSATVSRVLSNKPHVRPEVRQRVLASVDTLGYQPNRVARSLRAQTSSVIGLIISDIQNSFFNTIVRAIEDIAYEQGYAVFLCNSDENPEKEQMYLDILRAERVAGIILTPTLETATTCQSVLEVGIPVVALDRKVAGIAMDTVMTDNTEASYALVKSLIKQGCRRIAAILPDLGITTGRERYEGYRRAIQEAGLSEQVYSGRPVSDDGYALTRGCFKNKQKPDALFLGTKLMTLGALRYLYEHNLRVPDDVAMAAFDELDWMPQIPAMSVAVQPAYELGECAAKLLFQRLLEPKRSAEHVVLPSRLELVSNLSQKEVEAA